jgi:hypothetical protein
VPATAAPQKGKGRAMITVKVRAWVGHPQINATMRPVRPDVNGVYSSEDYTVTLAAPVPDLCEKIKAAIIQSGMDCARVEIISASEDQPTTKTPADDGAPKDT